MDLTSIAEEVIAGLIIAAIVGAATLLLRRYGPPTVPSFLQPNPGAKLIFITGALIMASGAVLDRSHMVSGGMSVCLFGILYGFLER